MRHTTAIYAEILASDEFTEAECDQVVAAMRILTRSLHQLIDQLHAGAPPSQGMPQLVWHAAEIAIHAEPEWYDTVCAYLQYYWERLLAAVLQDRLDAWRQLSLQQLPDGK